MVSESSAGSCRITVPVLASYPWLYGLVAMDTV
jgi:hypothetical protein